MSVFCRLTTAFALLLHLFFGCSMHHAVAFGGHVHDGCQHMDAADDSPSVHAAHDACYHHHDACDAQNLNANSISGQDSIIRFGFDCHSDPCDGDHPGCHGGLGCSFANSNDVQFVIETPMIAYLDTSLHDDDYQTMAFLAGAVADDVGWTAMGSRLHCALLCTWVI